MKTPVKLLIVAAVVAAAVAAVVLKQSKSPTDSPTTAASPSAVATATAEPASATAPATAKLPKLIDLGADKCIPCKMMAPILAEFKRDYADQFITEFIDVWKNPDAGKPYNIEMIPTQIFFNAEGKELFRHVGFYGKEDMLNKWRELGVNVSGGKASAPSCARRPCHPTPARPIRFASCAMAT